MVQRNLRGKREEGSDGLDALPHYPQNPSSPATAEDRARWNGFSEIESEPVGDQLSPIKVSD